MTETSEHTPRAGETGEAAPRGTLRLLVDRTVGSYVAAKVLASMGIWVHNVVAAILVYDVSGSALLVGAVSIAQFSPQVVLAPWMGAVADRGNRRRQVVAGRLLVAVGSGSLAAVLAILGLEGPAGAWLVIGAALVVGIGFAISAPAMHAIVPSMARPNELPAVIALTTAPFTFARAAGPALGALILVGAGAAAAFAFATLCQLVLAAVVATMPLRAVTRPVSADGSALAGLRHLRADRALGLLLLAVAGVGFGVDPVITLSPPIAAGFGEGAGLVATLASAFGVGAALTVLALGWLRRHVSQERVGTGGFWVLAAATLAFGLSPTPALAVTAVTVGGAGMMAAVTGLTTQIQQRVPEELRGRVMALWSVAFIGSRPLAAGLNGAVADVWSPQVALVLLAVVLAAVGGLTRPGRLARLAG